MIKTVTNMLDCVLLEMFYRLASYGMDCKIWLMI
jgi:hypothetical protein